MKIAFSSRFLLGDYNGISIETQRFYEQCQNSNIEVCKINDSWLFQKNYPKQTTNFQKILINLRRLKVFLFGLEISNLDADIIYLSQVSPIRYVSKKRFTIIYRIHDLFPISNPDWFPKRLVYIFKLSLWRIQENSTFFFNSKYTKEQFATQLIEFHDDGRILDCPLSERNSHACGACQGCNMQYENEGFIIAVGTIEPRKNYSTILDLYANSLTSDLPNLIVVGNYGWKQDDELRRFRNTQKIHMMEDLCPNAVENLYETASGFLSLSLGEGFDIPANEARLYGLPMVLSNIPVHVEHFASTPSVTLVNPLATEEILTALQFLKNHSKIKGATATSSSGSTFVELLRTIFDLPKS